MKVIIFVQNFGTVTTTFIYNEILHISKIQEVLVICCTRGDEKKYPFKKIELIPYKEGHILKKIKWILYKHNVKYIVYNSEFRDELNAVVKKFKPGILHGHFGNESLLFFKNLNHENRSIPGIVSFHGYDASSMLRQSKIYTKELRRFFLNSERKAICCSEFIRQNLIKSGIPLNKKNSEILFYGIKTDHFCRKSYNKSGKVKFLQISSFTEKKGHIYTVKAFDRFLKSNEKIDAVLIFAGGGPLEKNIKELVHELEISDKVIFKGWVTPEGAKELLEEADYFVHHSVTSENGDTEGMPNAIIEAMAMELPVISTIHAGIPELVENDINGYLVEERDIDSYAKCMKKIMNWNYIKINREKIKKLFSIHQHNVKLNKIYKDMTKS